MHEWWPVMHTEYWSCIFWQVPLNEKVNPKMLKEASVPIENDEDLTEEEKGGSDGKN